jgi:hypothetical protein
VIPASLLLIPPPTELGYHAAMDLTMHLYSVKVAGQLAGTNKSYFIELAKAEITVKANKFCAEVQHAS